MEQISEDELDRVGRQLSEHEVTHDKVYLYDGKIIKVISDEILFDIVDGQAGYVRNVTPERELELQSQAHARLPHNVPQILGAYKIGHKKYIVQQYIDHAVELYALQTYRPFEKLPLPHLNHKRISELFILSRMLGVTLLKKGILHGDLHTGNIMIQYTHEHGYVPFIIDFGRARMLNDHFCDYVYRCFKTFVFDRLDITREHVCNVLLNRVIGEPPEYENIIIILANLCDPKIDLYTGCKNIGCFHNYLAMWFGGSPHGIRCNGNRIIGFDLPVFREACRQSFDLTTFSHLYAPTEESLAERDADMQFQRHNSVHRLHQRIKTLAAEREQIREAVVPTVERSLRMNTSRKISRLTKVTKSRIRGITSIPADRLRYFHKKSVESLKRGEKEKLRSIRKFKTRWNRKGRYR